MMKDMRRKLGCLILLGCCQLAKAVEIPSRNLISTWATSPMLYPSRHGHPANATYRNVVRVSLGGRELRVRLTNTFGTTPLEIGAAHVALSANGRVNDTTIQGGTHHALIFGGHPTVIIPAGWMALSDIVTRMTPALSSLEP